VNVIACRKLCKTFYIGGQPAEILRDASIEVSAGEFVAITGRSGSGKTTLLNLIGMLDKPTSGEVTIVGQNVTGLKDSDQAKIRNEVIGYVFQSFYLEPEYTVLENVEMPLMIAGVSRKERRARAEALLQKVGLLHRMHQKAKLLSGGEKQRVCIARALINQPRIVLADEPTGNLDSTNSAEIMRIFRVIAEEGCAVVMVTHSQDDAEKADRIVHMKDGSLRDGEE